MRAEPNLKIERYRTAGPPRTNAGAFLVPFGARTLRVIASDDRGWDHVSVSLPDRCPTWQEMCAVKELFFRDDEVVMQLHPAKANYVNCHPNCLHLWRPQAPEEYAPVCQRWLRGGDRPGDYAAAGAIPLPPKELV